MNEIEIFKNDEFGEVRTTTIDGEPYFVGKDVLKSWVMQNLLMLWQHTLIKMTPLNRDS